MHFQSLGILASALALADATLPLVPAQTTVRFHLTAPLSSKDGKAHAAFAFVMAEPIVVDGRTIVAKDAAGSGTVLVDGHAGNSGHEGDITLRLDTVAAADGRTLVFDDQRVAINGRNRKIISAAAGFIPIVGFGSFFIRGSDVEIAPTTVISTVLGKPAHEVEPSPQPSASPEPSATPT